ncbi:MAG: Ig-like domain-containing protein [Capsulimonas sp.]|uniref:Ig-like domain-containing protein n=1 Tax=Capsulimonas sp. TaxID=2494211 RepID=UPI0032635AC5
MSMRNSARSPEFEVKPVTPSPCPPARARRTKGGAASGGFDIKRLSFTFAIRTPTASSQSVDTWEDTPVEITLTGDDPRNPDKSIIYAVRFHPSHGALTGNAPNLTYTPNPGYYGDDSFTFSVHNRRLSSAPAKVRISVAQAPAANITPRIKVAQGGYVYFRANGCYRQPITLTCCGAAIRSPLSLVLDNLSGATLTNATGTTDSASPAGSPYISTSGLGAGASMTIVLEFNKQPSSYVTRILAGVGAR